MSNQPDPQKILNALAIAYEAMLERTTGKRYKVYVVKQGEDPDDIIRRNLHGVLPGRLDE